MKTNIIIVGGGTAGWLTALYIRKRLPKSKITVVESESIGIVGVGEATTPYFISFMDYLDIPFSTLVSKTDTTLKQSIKFTNWNDDKKHYHHGFALDRSISLYALDDDHYLPDSSTVVAMSYAKNGEFLPADFHEILGSSCKVAFKKIESASLGYNPIFNYDRHIDFAAHFDTTKLSPLLKKIGIEEREIFYIEGKVVDQTLRENGDISSLKLDSGQELFCDFVVDCSGFSRKFIGKLYNSTWKSHKEALTVDSAIPFSLPMDTKIPTYTEAVAMQNGWMWKIPLQERYGCGYVFDSNYISEEQAKKEAEEFLGVEIDPRSPIRFSPGYYSTPWVNNCLAVGLSSGFIEPLESTSIWITLITLEEAFNDVDSFTRRDPKFVADFNKKFVYNSSRIFDFVYLHYMGKRVDTDFWRHYRDTKKAPEAVQNQLDIWSYRVPRYSDFRDHMFNDFSWLSVGAGLGLFNKEVFERSFESNRLYEVESQYNKFLRDQKTVSGMFVDHREFLESLK